MLKNKSLNTALMVSLLTVFRFFPLTFELQLREPSIFHHHCWDQLDMIWKSCAQKTWSSTTFACAQTLKLPMWLSCWDLVFKWNEVPRRSTITAEWPDGGLYTVRDIGTHPTGTQHNAVEVFFIICDWEVAGGWRKADWWKPLRYTSLKPIKRS